MLFESLGPRHLSAEGVDSSELVPNVLLLRIQPDEGVSLKFGSKVPGPEMRIRDVRMDFRYGSAFSGETAGAYERLLLDAMIGDSTLFARLVLADHPTWSPHDFGRFRELFLPNSRCPGYVTGNFDSSAFRPMIGRKTPLLDPCREVVSDLAHG